VLLRKSSQLKEAFFAAQRAVCPGEPPLAWIHNVATRWSSDYAMAERALQLRRALSRLFIDIEEQWHDRGSVASLRPEILSYKFTASEWPIISSLQLILKQFAIATDRLQGDPSTSSQNTRRFDEYLPTVELLLDHLETAVSGWIIDTSLEATGESFERVKIFWRFADSPSPFPTHAHRTLLTLTFYLGMDRKTRRLLKVYLRLGWLKLHAYYEKLTSIAYAGAIVMNPYRKPPYLTRLWQQVPDPQATSYFNDCKTRLRALWEIEYKNREIDGEIQASPLDTVSYRDYTSLRMQYRNSLGTDDQPQNSGRRRRHRVTMPIEDELDKFFNEPPIPETLYNGDSMA
jgi:hypothetical protein